MSSERRLRVLVVDDHDLVRWGLRASLTPEPWVERCIGASTSEHAMELARRYSPHVALVDMCLDKESGAALSKRLSESGSIAVLLMSGVGSIPPAAAKSVGASGFVSKAWSAQEIAQAVRMVGLGLTIFQPESQDPTLLSQREREVLLMIAAGSTNREIAAALYLSPHTIKDHTATLYRKVKARNRAEAVVCAQRLGLLT
jgi:DNA-binding NarL/FixJ family response regulator